MVTSKDPSTRKGQAETSVFFYTGPYKGTGGTKYRPLFDCTGGEERGSIAPRYVIQGIV